MVGPGEATDPQVRAAEALGAGLVALGALVVTGGLGGVMAAASRGAAAAGGTVLGLLPGAAQDANPWVTVAVPTGLGEGRDVLVVRAAQVVVAVGGSWGTLAEVALAVRTDVPVVVVDDPALDPWSVVGAYGAAVPGPLRAADVPAALVVVRGLLSPR